MGPHFLAIIQDCRHITFESDCKTLFGPVYRLISTVLLWRLIWQTNTGNSLTHNHWRSRSLADGHSTIISSQPSDVRCPVIPMKSCFSFEKKIIIVCQRRYICALQVDWTQSKCWNKKISHLVAGSLSVKECAVKIQCDVLLVFVSQRPPNIREEKHSFLKSNAGSLRGHSRQLL